MLRYHGDHAPDMAAALAETLVLIERIPDNRAHDARVARERLRAPVVACEATWQQFVDAVGADPAAAAILERATARLGRSLGIVFGHGQALGLDPRGWLAALDSGSRPIASRGYGVGAAERMRATLRAVAPAASNHAQVMSWLAWTRNGSSRSPQRASVLMSVAAAVNAPLLSTMPSR